MRKFIIFPCLIFLSVIFIGCNKGEKTMFNNQPILFLKISAYLCRFDLQVNGVSVALNPKKMPLEVTLPINHWLKEGDNEIVLIQDITGQKTLEGSSCEATLLVRQNDSKDSIEKEITNLHLAKGINESFSETRLDETKLEATENGKVISNKSSFKVMKDELTLKRTIYLPINLPKWKWLTSENIIDTKENRAGLYIEYEKIHKVLQNKNFTALSQIMDERVKELAAAFYISPQEMAESSGIQMDALDSEQELLGLDHDIEFQITGNGKLAELTRWNGKAQIVYGSKDSSLYGYYHMIFRKYGNQWILTR